MRSRCARVAGECYTVECMFDRADLDCSGVLTLSEPTAFARDVRYVGSALVAAGQGQPVYECAGPEGVSRADALRVAVCLVPGIRL